MVRFNLAVLEPSSKLTGAVWSPLLGFHAVKDDLRLPPTLDSLKDLIEKLVRLPLLSVGDVDGRGNVAPGIVIVTNIYDRDLFRANKGQEISSLNVSHRNFRHCPVMLKRRIQRTLRITAAAFQRGARDEEGR